MAPAGPLTLKVSCFSSSGTGSLYRDTGSARDNKKDNKQVRSQTANNETTRQSQPGWPRLAYLDRHAVAVLRAAAGLHLGAAAVEKAEGELGEVDALEVGAGLVRKGDVRVSHDLCLREAEHAC